ncbi:hypothetical protein OG875_23735 [Streptomyces sp. NBC_01498]|uniref:hypothetical protein n=1 Tax=Streptomyces sp. NBC_01498 TaxID=2975870 RepID=UPI002E7BC3AA|nr:hypothetical protein [Streptomyces sp. NBC_01498]WTL27313.1 hypothetical protein OG875_23735 [Streptomyces sp. NBC_01498]
MGWTVLYIAFGIVALWLLGEVLLQYKARLRWRLLAFTGFVGVVLGVLMASVPVIAVGAIAFAVGQTYVTLSFRRGFSTGWAIGGSPGASRRRRAAGPASDVREPSLEVSGLEYRPDPEFPDLTAAVPDEPPYAPSPSASVYEPEPMPDDTGQYGVYSDAAYQATQYGNYDPYTGYDAPTGGGTGYANGDAYDGQEQHAYGTADTYGATDPYASHGQDAYGGQDGYGAQDGYPGQSAGQNGQYDYGNGQQQYAAYTDPYSGATTDSYGGYDGYDGRQQQYAEPYDEQNGQAARQEYAADTPPGGVWVPQQREGEDVPPMPDQEPRPYGFDPAYDEQRYRY